MMVAALSFASRHRAMQWASTPASAGASRMCGERPLARHEKKDPR